MAVPTDRRPERRRLLLPGLLSPEPGLETYWVRAGGLTGIRLAAGDEVTVIDLEGRQAAELTTLGHGGTRTGARRRPGRAGDGAARPAWAGSRTRWWPTSSARASTRPRLDAARLFGEWSPPGAAETFTARAPGTVVVAAPGARMRPDERRRQPAVGPADRAATRGPGVRAAPTAARAARRAGHGLPGPPAHRARATRSRRASTSRSSTSRAASARTSWPSTPAGSRTAPSAGSTRPRRATSWDRPTRSRGCTGSSTTRTCSRSSRSCRTRWAGTTRSGWRATPSTTRTWATRGTSTAPTTSTPSSTGTASRSAPAGPR